MSFSDAELLRATAPWIGLGFVATLLLGFVFDVRGVVAAFGLGVVAPTLAYLPSNADGGLVEIVLEALRAPLPFSFDGIGGAGTLAEPTMDWWLGGAFAAGLGIYAGRRFHARVGGLLPRR